MKLENLFIKCAEFEKLAQTPMVIKACRSGSNFNFSPSLHGSLGPGFYFTTNEDRARKYSNSSQCIVWVEIHLQNPLVGPKLTLAKMLNLENHIDEDSGAYDYNIGKKLSDLANEQGYDGIVAGESNGLHHEVVVFNLTSIKPLKKDCLTNEGSHE